MASSPSVDPGASWSVLERSALQLHRDILADLLDLIASPRNVERGALISRAVSIHAVGPSVTRLLDRTGVCLSAEQGAPDHRVTVPASAADRPERLVVRVVGHAVDSQRLAAHVDAVGRRDRAEVDLATTLAAASIDLAGGDRTRERPIARSGDDGRGLLHAGPRHPMPAPLAEPRRDVLQGADCRDPLLSREPTLSVAGRPCGELFRGDVLRATDPLLPQDRPVGDRLILVPRSLHWAPSGKPRAMMIAT